MPSSSPKFLFHEVPKQVQKGRALKENRNIERRFLPRFSPFPHAATNLGMSSVSVSLIDLLLVLRRNCSNKTTSATIPSITLCFFPFFLRKAAKSALIVIRSPLSDTKCGTPAEKLADAIRYQVNHPGAIAASTVICGSRFITSSNLQSSVPGVMTAAELAAPAIFKATSLLSPNSLDKQ